MGLNKNKMKKENVFVKTKSREQANLYRNVLKEIGQTIRQDFNTNTQLDEPDLDYRENGWILGYSSASKTEITFGQLIDLLNEPKKIAVKVENEKEFKALMKYYDSLVYSDWDGDKPLSIEYPLYYKEDIISFEDNFVFPSIGVCESYLKNKGTKYDPNTYKIIPFSEFAEQHGIKLPHITTHDGVDLYIGDYLACVWKQQGEWELTQGYPSIHSNTVSEAGQSALEGERKLFSTKKAALDWIEEQKPKNVIISPDSVYPIIVYRKPVCGDEYIHLDMSKRGDYNGANIHLTIDELRQAVKTYDEMHS